MMKNFKTWAVIMALAFVATVVAMLTRTGNTILWIVGIVVTAFSAYKMLQLYKPAPVAPVAEPAIVPAPAYVAEPVPAVEPTPATASAPVPVAEPAPAASASDVTTISGIVEKATAKEPTIKNVRKADIDNIDDLAIEILMASKDLKKHREDVAKVQKDREEALKRFYDSL